MGLVAALAALAVQVSPPGQLPSPPLSEGQLNYEYFCKSCHEPGQPGAPDRAELARMRPSTIVRALEKGRMKAMGAQLTLRERREIAAFITGR